ncbi:type II toxin-antitoxin system RelE/ParE family toxin [Halochromatium sp.]
MILSTKGKLAAQAVAGRFGKGFPGDLVKRTRAMLAALDAAVELALSGNRSGQHSVRINDQWRICFTWTNEGPSEVEVLDYQ